MPCSQSDPESISKAEIQSILDLAMIEDSARVQFHD
jgi:hypothetical protein